MDKYRKKPVIIEAEQFLPGEKFNSLDHNPRVVTTHEGVFIDTLEGRMKVEPGDWVIRGIKGELYPCKPDIFSATYESADQYPPTKNLTFSEALNYLKAGAKVSRAGWNGKGMWVCLIPGSTFQVTEGRPLAAHIPVGSEVKYRPHLDMKTVDGEIVPWVISQSDALADDWEVV